MISPYALIRVGCIRRQTAIQDPSSSSNFALTLWSIGEARKSYRAKRNQRSSSPPSCHARAPHHREARVDAVAGIARTDADEVTNSAKSPIPANQRAQPVAAHDLVAIKMSPMRPFPTATITTKANV